jgi:hypothetical protein
MADFGEDAESFPTRIDELVESIRELLARIDEHSCHSENRFGIFQLDKFDRRGEAEGERGWPRPTMPRNLLQGSACPNCPVGKQGCRCGGQTLEWKDTEASDHKIQKIDEA